VQEKGKEFVTQDNMKASIEYTIVAVPFHADAATHEELARKVNEKLSGGYDLYGPPFLSEEMMYQAMTKPILPN
jgi:Domain of unknown function (DUF1737)